VRLKKRSGGLTTAKNPLAAKRGLRYQTYLKMLLHEALKSEKRS
jgi:predicted DNA binding CopG/RHH family protein